ncbi:MAG TPA: EamA family transporter [Actinomycetota bacterium]|nr:EamA family transporter [Actinomycetota bacterium]
MSSTHNAPDRATLIAFVGAAFIGGSNFVAVRFSNEDLDPMFGATLRFALATLILFGIMGVMRLPVPRGRGAWGAVVYGVLGFGVSYALLYIALVELDAGMSSVILAGTPLFTLVLAVLHRQERFTVRGLIGGALAILGIGILSAGSLQGDIPPAYLLAAVLGMFAVAESSVLIKAFPRLHPITTNAFGMGAGTIFLALASLTFGERWTLPATSQTWFVVGWLVVAGSVGLFVLFLFVIARWTASASVYALTLMPLVAVTLGALLKDEPITTELIVGGALVLFAVYIGAITGQQRTHVPETPQPLVVAPETTGRE